MDDYPLDTGWALGGYFVRGYQSFGFFAFRCPFWASCCSTTWRSFSAAFRPNSRSIASSVVSFRACFFFGALAMSKLTTQPAVNLLSILEAYDTDSECRAYLEELRWPKGVECPRCQSKKISRIKARKVFDCDGCRYQFS